MVVGILVAILLLLGYTTLILFYTRVWKNIPTYTGKQSGFSTAVSVVIAARNEERHILGCLQALKCQTYPNMLYEVIVVDDHSKDATWQLLQTFTPGRMRLKTLHLSEWLSPGEVVVAYKKKAIDIAISQAAGKLIVATDADCTMATGWLAALVSFYESTQAKFIAAPVALAVTCGLLDIFQTLDFMTMQGITGAAVQSHFHSMCNGANLAYEKQAFLQVGGFRSIDAIPTGDDMLLMHKIYRQYPANVYYLKSREAIVTTAAQTSWKDFFAQRIRWSSKASRYDDRSIFWVLLLVYMVNLIILAFAIAGCWNVRFLWVVLGMLVIKTLVEFPMVRLAAIFFNQRRFLVFFPLLQPLHIVYVVLSGLVGRFGSYRWKEREVKTH